LPPDSGTIQAERNATAKSEISPREKPALLQQESASFANAFLAGITGCFVISLAFFSHIARDYLKRTYRYAVNRSHNVTQFMEQCFSSR